MRRGIHIPYYVGSALPSGPDITIDDVERESFRRLVVLKAIMALPAHKSVDWINTLLPGCEDGGAYV